MEPTGYEELTLTYFLENVLGINFKLIGWFFIILIALFWALGLLWVLKDASNRYKDADSVFYWGILVLLSGFLGVAIYLIFRPEYTLAEKEQLELYKKALLSQVLSLVRCPTCGTYIEYQIDHKHKYCNQCGTKLYIQCKNCKSIQPFYARYCSSCKAPLKEEMKEQPKQVKKAVLKRKEAHKKEGHKTVFISRLGINSVGTLLAQIIKDLSRKPKSSK